MIPAWQIPLYKVANKETALIGNAIGFRKMKILKSTILLLVLFAILSGCMAPKTIVDPTYGTTKYDDISRPTAPKKFMVLAEFQRNGQHYPKVDSTLKDIVERVLRASGVVSPATDSAFGEMDVVVNNFGDRGNAAAKGFATGLTFGLVGNTVTDYYEMRVAIHTNGKIVTKDGIKHALHTKIGMGSTPPGLEALPIQTAFERAVEQMLLNAIKEFQQSGVL